MFQKFDYYLRNSQAHDCGLVHRDLKPSNLFLTQRSDGRPLVKVLDFGISKSVHRQAGVTIEDTLTTTRSIMGSSAYMSPEQMRDVRSVDYRSDLWALGAVIYELASGKPLPFSMPGGGCGTYAATDHALFFRAGQVTMWDTAGGKPTKFARLRPDCWLSTIPACGMLLSPEGGGGCSCGSWMETSVGFLPVRRN